MYQINKKGVACTALALALSACGGSDGDNSASTPAQATSSLLVQPSLGQIQGADVVVKSLDGKVLGSGSLDAGGVLKLSLAASSGPLLIEVNGKTGAKYFDEGLSAELDLPAGETLHAVLASAQEQAGVTVLTEIAYQRLLASKGGKLADATAADIVKINEEVRAQFAPELKSIVSAPKLVNAKTGAGALDDDEIGRYALKLAALAKAGVHGLDEAKPALAADAADAKVALGAQRPALALGRQLARDFADGKFDGKEGAKSLVDPLYAADTFHDRIQDKLLQAAQQLGSAKLVELVQKGGAVPAGVGVVKAEKGTQLDLAILQTTDLHTNIKSYDYYKTQEDITLGFERTATLIDKARAELPNNLLVDNGDTIQGTSLSDYQAQVNPVSCNDTLAQYKVMNLMRYDAGNIGNHEFNYGLPFLAQVTGAAMRVPGTEDRKGCMGPRFPLVLSNAYAASDKQPLFSPYVILNRTFKTADGKRIALKVGVIGFAPPGIMSWDKRNLDGKVYVEGIKESAEKYVPAMRKAGADIVVALSHGGISAATYSPSMENAVYHLAKVPGIDAIVSGHSHSYFPDGKNFAGIAGVDNVKGLVNGVPTVMAGFWGNTLGVLKLGITYDGAQWKVTQSQGELRAINSKVGNDTVAVAPHAAIGKLVQKEHEGTIRYVSTPVGNTEFRISSFFSQVGDTAAMQLINAAQRDYVEKYVKTNLPQYASLPVLSAAAPFKSNFRATGYTDIPAGGVAIKNVADLYLYPNTLQAVKIDGATMKAWLEKAAEQFNQIDPSKTADQQLINGSFPSYNFDQIDGVQYEIDVTKPKGSRIVNLRWKGQPLPAGQEFIVATNNYRASGGGGFTSLDGSKTIFDAPDANRDIIVAYIKAQKTLTRAAQGSDGNWRFAKVTLAGRVLFESALDAEAVARADGIANVFKIEDKADKSGSIYKLDLSL
ncbi:bifunctional 2',3'-cyclic-nucleotide 2'-phosphodiesterase/3'-nucleotidase [Jeongeupia sp. HS-3]|uniref:bifunctional 2',3'-cyclic-nucleotide 2'-phosphodiesterase/3'-nucleotidase n=1 Tax=Jeongeupia sp. HS-3 TaxID=1009682 RepID=UPI0019103C49|nr:bifunctional 2',3'-cyclic-nucleotide 2'-phosphodiesterase/3'-nucleotidase [Jeongeupia sp. HS-3]